MEYVNLMRTFGSIISFFSIIVILWGVIIALFQFFKNEFSRTDMKAKVLQRASIRASLGSYILLSLEILIVADIIDTIAQPKINEVMILITIVFLRTFISYFLQKEIKEASIHE